jgi:hypothetical protein
VNSNDFRPPEVSLGQLSDSSPLRLFLSFNPPPTVINHLSQAQKTLRRLLDCFYGSELPIRWTRSFQFHLTVLFFGNRPAAKMNSIRTRLIELVGDRPEFPCLTAKGFGCFPAFRRPRVLQSFATSLARPIGQSFPRRFRMEREGSIISARDDRSIGLPATTGSFRRTSI